MRQAQGNEVVNRVDVGRVLGVERQGRRPVDHVGLAHAPALAEPDGCSRSIGREAAVRFGKERLRRPERVGGRASAAPGRPDDFAGWRNAVCFAAQLRKCGAAEPLQLGLSCKLSRLALGVGEHRFIDDIGRHAHARRAVEHLRAEPDLAGVHQEVAPVRGYPCAFGKRQVEAIYAN